MGGETEEGMRQEKLRKGSFWAGHWISSSYGENLPNFV
jgi:hypothetical protein